eukprot:scaffold395_cov383-Prasinococcus_capsulatus_cf.AAC.13
MLPPSVPAPVAGASGGRDRLPTITTATTTATDGPVACCAVAPGRIMHTRRPRAPLFSPRRAAGGNQRAVRAGAGESNQPTIRPTVPPAGHQPAGGAVLRPDLTCSATATPAGAPLSCPPSFRGPSSPGLPPPRSSAPQRPLAAGRWPPSEPAALTPAMMEGWMPGRPVLPRRALAWNEPAGPRPAAVALPQGADGAHGAAPSNAQPSLSQRRLPPRPERNRGRPHRDQRPAGSARPSTGPPRPAARLAPPGGRRSRRPGRDGGGGRAIPVAGVSTGVATGRPPPCPARKRARTCGSWEWDSM